MTVLLESAIMTAGPADRRRLFDTLTAAFASDPAVRWLYPDPDQYRRHFPGFVQAFAGGAIERGTAYYVDGHRGAALWLPPTPVPTRRHW